VQDLLVRASRAARSERSLHLQLEERSPTAAKEGLSGFSAGSSGESNDTVASLDFGCTFTFVSAVPRSRKGLRSSSCSSPRLVWSGEDFSDEVAFPAPSGKSTSSPPEPRSLDDLRAPSCSPRFFWTAGDSSGTTTLPASSGTLIRFSSVSSPKTGQVAQDDPVVSLDSSSRASAPRLIRVFQVRALSTLDVRSGADHFRLVLAFSVAARSRPKRQQWRQRSRGEWWIRTRKRQLFQY
jgi:hypothetical protein